MQKLMIAFKGLNNVFEEKSTQEWCDANGYTLVTFPHYDVQEANEYVRGVDCRHIEILGYSRGCPSAYELARKTPLQYYERLLTVGSQKEFTLSLNKTRMPLKNVRQHLNFAEAFQQPADFHENPINVSLAECSHFDAVKTALKILSAPQLSLTLALP